MLCDECHQREANVFLTQITNGHMRKAILCAVCGADTVKLATDRQPHDGGFPSLAFEGLAAADPRYAPPAYAFVFRSMAHAFRAAPPQEHLPASAVALAFRELARSEFGAAALDTLAAWGIGSCEDIGVIVFRLIGVGLLGSQPGEGPQDFSGLYEFSVAFPVST